MKAMYIVLDSNIFFNSWYIRSAEFERLISHANNVSATLLISQVVLDEVNAKFAQHVSDFRADHQKLKNAYARLIPERTEWTDIMIEQPYNLGHVLRSRFKRVDIASYEGVSHQSLVAKAIRCEMPFQISEKGYRDALMWLTLLDYLRAHRSDRRVVFINENTKDFFVKRGDALALHPVLQSDWERNENENELVL
jgi:hypothetical protein